MVAAAVKDFVPRPYQRLMFEFLHRVPRCCLFVPMGAGKSSAVLWALLSFLLIGYSKRVLVLAPLRVAKSTWPDEAAKWSTFSDLRVSYIGDWTAEERAFLQARAKLQKAVKRDERCALPATKALMDEVDKSHVAAQRSLIGRIRQLDVMTCNYDRVQELVDILADKCPFDTVVADESTKLRSYRTRQGGKRSSALASVAFLPRVKRWINLTGTPVPNGLAGLWAQLFFVDRGARLGKSYTAFESRWFGFKRKQDAHGYKPGAERILLPHAEAEIRALIADVCFTLDMRDWVDLREPLVNRIYIDLPPDARRRYNEFEREMFTRIEGHEITAGNAAVKSMRALQLCNGVVYVNGSNDEWVTEHDEKIEALRSVVEEAAGAPVLVSFTFRSDLARILSSFPAARHLDSDPQTIKDWNEGRIPILVAHPQAAGHGISLQDGSNILVFYSIDWNLETHQQMVERIGPMRQMQAGHNRPVFLHYILARNTVDETVMKRLTTKASVQQTFLDAMDAYNKRGAAC